MEEVYCFGGNLLDRKSERRDDHTWIGELLDDPGTRVLALSDLKPFARRTTADRLAPSNGVKPSLEWQSVAAWRKTIDAGATLVFLGLGDGRAHFAIDGTQGDAVVGADVELAD